MAHVLHLYVFRVLPELLLPTRHVRVAAHRLLESYGVAAFKQPLYATKLLSTALDAAQRAAEAELAVNEWVWLGKKPVRSPSPTASASQNTPLPLLCRSLLSS